MLWLTVLVFVGLLLLLVLTHEWGHFFAARRAGCRVEEFAFGFPPRLFAFKRGGTQYSFNLLPIGGYVKIEGEDMNDPDPAQTSFASKSAPWRILILSAGVIMNVVLAAVLLSFQAGVGRPVLVTEDNAALVRDIKTFIVDINIGSPGENAGLESLDRIAAVGDVTNPDIAAVQETIADHAGRELTLEVERQGIHHVVTVVPRENPPPDEGAVGIGLQETGLLQTPWWQAPWRGVVRTGQMLVAIVGQFWLLFTRLVSGETVGDVVTGPVGIAIFTNEVTNLGLSYVLEFAALISLNLALINILPFPALDGGRILFVGLELIAGRRLPAKVEHFTHLAGFVVLIALMLFVTFKDVTRFF